MAQAVYARGGLESERHGADLVPIRNRIGPKPHVGRNRRRGSSEPKGLVMASRDVPAFPDGRSGITVSR